MKAIPFTKMVAAGNDFLVVDAVHHPLRLLRRRWAAVSRTLCDRHEGVGADGVLVLEPARGADVRMRVFNPDGSEAEMCGNGARCVARFVHEWNGRPAHREITIETLGGPVRARVGQGRVRIALRNPAGIRRGLRLAVDGRVLTGTFLNTGVPHLVVPVRRLAQMDAARLGRLLRRHRAFAPRGTNVNFIQSEGRSGRRLSVRTYERGVEEETLACGTGVTASAIAHALQQAGPSPRVYRIRVRARSGESMTVSCRAARQGQEVRVSDVVLEGSARRICDGTAAWPQG